MRPLKLSESISDAIAIGIDKTFRNVSISITHESELSEPFVSLLALPAIRIFLTRQIARSRLLFPNPLISSGKRDRATLQRDESASWRLIH